MIQMEKIDWSKMESGLIPAVVQDHLTGQVLMLGYMNTEALAKTQKENRVTFFSRSKNRLWTKGESSGNFLEVKKIFLDCDADSILIQADPKGPTCHTGANSCFSNAAALPFPLGFLGKLYKKIDERATMLPKNSYATELFNSGIDRIAQKVGEEAVETIIAAKNSDDAAFSGEAADLIFHLLVLCRAKNISIAQVIGVLESREKS